MFNPRDFFDFPKELKTCTFHCTEAQQRTMISRMYYASFLAFRELVRNHLRDSQTILKYGQLSRSPQIHGAISEIVNELDSHTRNLLRTMRKARNYADYDLTTSIPPFLTKILQSEKMTNKIFTNQMPLLSRRFPGKEFLINRVILDWHNKMMNQFP